MDEYLANISKLIAKKFCLLLILNALSLISALLYSNNNDQCLDVSTADYKGHNYFMPCKKFGFFEGFKECRLHDFSLARLDSLQNVVFTDGITDGNEYWIGPNYVINPNLFLPPLKYPIHKEYLSKDGQVKNGRFTQQHSILCEQEKQLKTASVPEKLKSSFTDTICSTLSCYVKLSSRATYKAAIKKCKHFDLRFLKIKSWAEFDFIKENFKAEKFWFFTDEQKSVKYNPLQKEVVICEWPKSDPGSEGFTKKDGGRIKRSTSVKTSGSKKSTTPSSVKANTKPSISRVVSTGTMLQTKYSAKEEKKKTAKTKKPNSKGNSKTPKITYITLPVTISENVRTTHEPKKTTMKTTDATTTTTAENTSKRIPFSSETTGFDPKSKITSTQTKSTKEDSTSSTTSSDNQGSRLFQCKDGKMWKTNDLTSRGQLCFEGIVRSALECIAVSQQQKCPHVFYQKKNALCQIFDHSTSKTSAGNSVNCLHDFCYTCI